MGHSDGILTSMRNVAPTIFCGAGVPPAPGVWHFSAVVLAGRFHGEVLIDDILESRFEGQVAFLWFRIGVGW